MPDLSRYSDCFILEETSKVNLVAEFRKWIIQWVGDLGEETKSLVRAAKEKEKKKNKRTKCKLRKKQKCEDSEINESAETVKTAKIVRAIRAIETIKLDEPTPIRRSERIKSSKLSHQRNLRSKRKLSELNFDTYKSVNDMVDAVSNKNYPKEKCLEEKCSEEKCPEEYTWSCLVCTLENKSSDIVCQACQTQCQAVS